jgi:outer membrane protein assembly factor BamB
MKTTFRSLCVALTFTSAALAGEWPNLRGPNFDGSALDEKNLPVKFSATENVAWELDLPGPAASTPAVWGGHVFVTAANPDEKKLYGIAVDRKSGKVLWKHVISEGYQWDERSNLASPSPTTDGKLVYFFFGDGILAAFDFSGKAVWKKDLEKEYGKFATQWTYSSSPVLADGRIYLQVLQRDKAFEFNGRQKGEPDGKNDSYVLALDPASGKELWKVIRPCDAKEESMESFSSPVFYKGSKRSEILIVGGDCITGHDPAKGTELWRWGSWNPSKIGHWRLVPSAVAGDDVVLACAPKREPIFAFKLGLNGTQKEDAILWQSDKDGETKNVSSDVSTPAYANGRFYVVNSDRKSICCVEPKSGKLIWDHAIESPDVRLQKFESSPTVADGKIYVIDHMGTVVVLAASDKYEVLAINKMGSEKEQYVRSTVVAAHGQLFIRTTGKLFCVGK